MFVANISHRDDIIIKSREIVAVFNIFRSLSRLLILATQSFGDIIWRFFASTAIVALTSV